MTYTLDNYSSQTVSNKDNRTCVCLGLSSAKEQPRNYDIDIITLVVLLFKQRSEIKVVA